MDPLQFFYNLLVLYFFLKNQKVDVIHINNGGYPGASSCNAAVFAARLSRIKIVTYTVNNIVQPYKGKRKLGVYFDKVIKAKITQFITASCYAGQILKSTLKINETIYSNIPNGVELRKSSIDRRKFLKNLGIEDTSLVFGVVALHEDRKGHIFLLRAYKKLEIEGLSSELIIEGSGPLTLSLQDYCTTHNLESVVHLSGIWTIYTISTMQ